MKAVKRLLSFALIVATLFSLAACSSDGNDTVVATVNGEKVYRWQIINLFNQNKSYYEGIAGVDLDDTKNFTQKQQYMKELLEQAIDNTVLFVSAKANGCELTEEERKIAVDDDYNSFVERNVKFYAENNFRGDANAQEKAEKKLQQSLKENNLTQERIKLGLYINAVSKKLSDKLTADINYDEAELKKLYEERVAEQKEKYTKDPSTYAQDAITPQSLVFYSPAGYIRVKHILIGLPKEIQSRVDKLSAELVDLLKEQVELTKQKGAEDAAVVNGSKKIEKLQSDIDLLRKQGIEQSKPSAEEVLKKVEDGVNFDMLMDEYGTDPGMKEYPANQFGYLINKDTNFIAEFKDAAFALQNVDDTTGLVQSTYGYHIIKLVDKIQEGATPFEKVEKILRDMTSAPEIAKIVADYIVEAKKGMKIERFENRL